MSKEYAYSIVVDSGCELKNLDGFACDGIGFFRAPMKLQVGEKSFTDDYDLNVDEFMKEMSAYQGKTGSAAPSPGEYAEYYENAKQIVTIAITGSLSGSYDSAITARRMTLEDDSTRKKDEIAVINSLTAGPEISLMVRKAAELMKEGLSAKEIEEKLMEYKEHTGLLFVLESLDNFVKNGRVSKLVGNIAGVLGIKIQGCASEEGTLEVLNKCRGKSAAYDKLIEVALKRNYSGGRVMITHCNNEEKALYLKGKVLELYPDADVRINDANGLISYYIENKGVLFGFEHA